MLTKKQMYMLIGFIVIIIASLVVMPETDGFKTFWGTFGLSKRRKNSKSSGICSKRGKVDNGNGQCVSCYSDDKSKPVWNKLQNICTSCSTIDSTKTYYNPFTGKCVDKCPGYIPGTPAVAADAAKGISAVAAVPAVTQADSNNVCLYAKAN